MKIAKVSPFYKGENSLLAKNYWLTSALPTLSKILIRIMYTGTFRYLTVNKVLPRINFFCVFYSYSEILLNLLKNAKIFSCVLLILKSF